MPIQTCSVGHSHSNFSMDANVGTSLVIPNGHDCLSQHLYVFQLGKLKGTSRLTCSLPLELRFPWLLQCQRG